VNGLQVEGTGEVARVMGAIDACQASIEAAAAWRADLLLVHHGLFWGGLLPIRGRLGRRVRTLITNGVALYSAHLPLDCHPEVGNSAVLARDLGIRSPAPFGWYEGVEIGVTGAMEVSMGELAGRIARTLGVEPHVIAKGPEWVSRVAVVTGAASSLLGEARDRGIDTFVTGEGPHHTFFDAEEWGLNLVYAGHYATETVGIQALGRHLRDRFAVEFEFFDHPTGL
jgi:dinuclear metal center YbgI/SA1388 family protein